MSSSPLHETSPDEWLAAIVDSSDDAIVGKTLDSIIRSWNAGATRIFGYEPSEIIGQSVLRLIPPELQHEEPEILAKLSRGERIDHYETVRLRKDGTRIDVSLSVSPIRDRSGAVVGAAKIARDVSEAKRLQRVEREHTEQLQELAAELENQVEEAQSLQEELEQTNEQLAAALDDAQEARAAAEDANAAKSQFLATMSHELRTPLNAIAGYVDLLDAEVRGSLNEAQRKDLGRIKRSQQTLLHLIEDVLSFAKLESGHLHFDFQPVALDELLGSLEAFIAPHLGRKGLDYRVDTCGADVIAYIDREKVQQIALNLLSNALKFTDTGCIAVSCSVQDKEIRIHVRDTGPGIPAGILESIFEPFVQGDRSFTRTSEGTGLGLSISRELARAMGGDVTVESTLGTGSTFTIVLPRGGIPTVPLEETRVEHA